MLSSGATVDRPGGDSEGAFSLPSVASAELPEQIVSSVFCKPTTVSLTELETRGQQARQRGDAATLCDVTSLRAFASLSCGDLEQALELARRASCMSRTEALLPQECLANLVLARVRRQAGQAHLAIRILAAVKLFAPASMGPWLDWELNLAWGVGNLGSVAAPSGRLATSFEAARLGDRHRWQSSVEQLLGTVQGYPPLIGDVRAVAAAVDPLWPEAECPSALRAWRRGETHAIPLGLYALSGCAVTPARVVGWPKGRGTRFLEVGVALCGHEAQYSTIPATRGSRNRPDSLLASLLLAGAEGSSDEELFLATYGFPFKRSSHQGALDVLVNRARRRLEGIAEVERVPGGYRILCSHPVVVPDPRTTAHDSERILRFIAQEGRVDSAAISEALGLSLRKVQRELGTLAQNGVCQRERAGPRRFEYRVEDSIFCEPTKVQAESSLRYAVEQP